MRLRDKKTGDTNWYSYGFNINSLNEIIVHHEEHGADSTYLSDWDVWLPQLQNWKDLKEAFADHDLITDNYNTHFFEPKNEMDRKRGYTL